MEIFDIIGKTAVIITAVGIVKKVFRHFVPKKYKWSNCPKDHDTMSRYGMEKCDTCGSEL